MSILIAFMLAGSPLSPEQICESAAQKLVYNEVEERVGEYRRTPEQIIGDFNRELSVRVLASGSSESIDFWRDICRGWATAEATRLIRESQARSDARIAPR